MRQLVLAVTVASLFNCGCASYTARRDQDEVHLYPGVRQDAYYLVHPKEADVPCLQWLNIVDMPFSAIADTVLIPVDLVNLTGDPYAWIPYLDPNSSTIYFH
jgi:uncharacterized protein YceK